MILMFKCEVYGVKYNGELVYVGKTQCGMLNRKNQHKSEAYNRLFSDPFHTFIREVGWDNLEWYVIEKCNSQEEITEKEKYYIKTLKPKYNKQEKAFYVYDLEGNFIGEFNNIYDTSKILNIEPRLISKCLSGDKNKSHGYIFTYENVDIEEKIFKAKHPHIYKQLSWNEIKQIYSLFKDGNKKIALAKEFAIDRKNVMHIVNFFEGGGANVR